MEVGQLPRVGGWQDDFAVANWVQQRDVGSGKWRLKPLRVVAVGLLN